MILQNISIYPIKSLGSIELTDSEVTPRGLKFDRRYMVVDKDWNCLTQRDFSRFAGLKTHTGEGFVTIDDGTGSSVEWRHGSGSHIGSKQQEVRVWDSVVDAEIAEDPVNRWLSELLERQVYLVHMPDSSKRAINVNFDRGNEIVSFADGYPLLLTTTGSLNDLNSNLDEKVNMERFRPNVVVSNKMPFDEDNWKRIEIGSSRFRITKPCARCVVTTIDQESGNRIGNEPLKTLSQRRKAIKVFPDRFEKFGLNSTDALFGINLVPEGPCGSISINDQVNILETWD